MFRLLPGALAARGENRDSDVDIEESPPGSASTVKEPQMAKLNFLHARNSVGWSEAKKLAMALLCTQRENNTPSRTETRPDSHRTAQLKDGSRARFRLKRALVRANNLKT